MPSKRIQQRTISRFATTILSCATVALAVNIFAPLKASAGSQKLSTYKTTRTYNYNWQADIVAKHPNASHFNWTPMILTSARRLDSHSVRKPTNSFHYRKPRVVATVMNQDRIKTANTSSLSNQLQASIPHTQTYLTYSNTPANCNTKLSYKSDFGRPTSERSVVSGRLVSEQTNVRAQSP